MTIEYAWEQLYGAVSTLACGSQPIQKRLVDAWVSRLHRIKPEEDLPKNECEMFIQLMEKVTKLPSEQVGSFQTTIMEFDDNTANNMAENIVSLFYRVTCAYEITCYEKEKQNQARRKKG